MMVGLRSRWLRLNEKLVVGIPVKDDRICMTLAPSLQIIGTRKLGRL
jgi:hypothetical protein